MRIERRRIWGNNKSGVLKTARRIMSLIGGNPGELNEQNHLRSWLHGWMVVIEWQFVPDMASKG